MSSASRFFKHVFAGGWATDYGPTAFVAPDITNVVKVPWLNEAQNVIYKLDGGPRKAPGCSANTSALESGADIMGVFDAWFSGTAGVPVQHRILHAGTKIKKDNANDTFTDLFTGMTAGAVPCYTMFEDLLIISNDSGTDVPKSWDGTTAQNLAGTPPTFAFSCVHKNRTWAAGNPAFPSRLYYSVSLNGADWVGGGSGTIDIDPSDGDRITGIASHKDELWVFKGPYKGSIHRISGSSSSDFARTTFVTGIGAVNHLTILPFTNDLAFMWSDGSIRSLQATNNFGDYDESAMSREIRTYLQEHVNLNALRFAQAAHWPDYSLVLYALPIDASTSCNTLLAMDYRFTPPRWSLWSSFNMITSLGSAVSLASSKQRTVIAGGTDGILRTLGRSTRTIDTSTPITFNVALPYLDYGVPEIMKTLEAGCVTLNPKTAGNITFGWTRDYNAQQTASFSQGGTSLLDSFTLDTSVLGGGQFYNAFFTTEEGGEFRSISYQILDAVAGQDTEVHNLLMKIKRGAESMESA